MSEEGSGSWREMDPFEKARRWHKVSPEMAELLIRQAKEHADERMQLQAEQQRHAMRLAEENSKHLRSMDVRRWRVQAITTIGGLACIGLLIAVAWQFAHTGNVVPGIAIFTLGGGLIAGVYGVNRSIEKKAASLAQQIRMIGSAQQADQAATAPEVAAP